MKLQRSLLNIIVASIIISFFSIVIISKLPTLISLSKTENEILKKIEEQHELTLSLEEELESYGTDDFVERIAREQLGFVKRDEIVFIKEATN